MIDGASTSGTAKMNTIENSHIPARCRTGGCRKAASARTCPRLTRLGAFLLGAFVFLGPSVNVTDANVLPEISGPTTITVPENTPTNVVIATYTATDADPGDILSFGGLVGDDDGKFSGDSELIQTILTIKLKFRDVLDFEMPTDSDGDSVYEVLVWVRDSVATGRVLPVTVRVTDVNEFALVAMNDTATTDEDTAVVIPVLANDSDADGSTILSVTAVGTGDDGPRNGTAAITPGSRTTITYTPDENFNGTDTFRYTVSNGTVPPQTATGTVTVTVHPEPDAPTASPPSSVPVFEDTADTLKVADFGFRDVDGDELSYVTILSLPDQGTLWLDGVAVTANQEISKDDIEAGKLTYTPPADADGSAFSTAFNFKVNDGTGDSAEATVTIDVVPVLPVSFGAAAYEADEGGEAVAVKVRLDRPAIVALTIPITMTPRGETVAADYQVDGLAPSTAPGVAGTLTFGTGEDTRTFFITAEEDDDFDDETVTLGFGTLPTGAEAGKPAAARLTLIDDEAVAIQPRFRRLNDEILSKHALTLADVTVAAVTSRMDAGACASQPNTASLGGQSSLAEILRANAQTLNTGSFNLKQLLGTSSFRLRLTKEDSGAGPGCLTLWGQGDYRNLSSGASQALNWDGDLVTGQVGADTLLRPDLLAGLAVSWSDGAFDYTDRTTGEPFSGDYRSRMLSVHPYVTWWSPMGLDLWATGGYGRGEIEIADEEAAGTHSSDTTLRLGSVGASGPLPIGDALIAGGTTTLRVKAQASLAQMDVEGNGSLPAAQTIDAQRLRLALEGSHERPLASGGSLTPSFEVGLRHDGGDGATGTGLELGGGLRYVDPALGLTIEGRGRVLAAYDEAYKEWGASGLIRVDPGIDGLGLSLSLAPSYGQTASGVQRLWDQGLTQGPTQGLSAMQAPTGRLEAEVGYGLAAFAGQGLVTPYSAVSLGMGTQQYRMGSRLELGPGLRLSLEGTRQVTTVGQADHGIRLQTNWRF